MKTCKQCHTKKSEREFTKGKAVCKLCRATVIKTQRTQDTLASKEEFKSFYNDFIKGSETFLTIDEFEKYKENPKYKIIDCLNKKQYPLYNLTCKTTTWHEDKKKGLINGVYIMREYNENGSYVGMRFEYYVYNPERYSEFM